MPLAPRGPLRIRSIHSQNYAPFLAKRWRITARFSGDRLCNYGYATVTGTSGANAAFSDPILLNLPHQYWSRTLDDEKSAFWLNSLQTEYRLRPMYGIPRTWEKIKESGDMLPMQGPLADELWRLLIQDVDLHQELYQYALGVKAASGILFDKLYEYMIGRLFATVAYNSEEHPLVLKWHNLFLQEYFVRPGALNALAPAAKASRSNLELFRQIYRRSACSPRQGVYDLIVPDLCKLKEWKLALDWHFFLYSQGDFPQGSSFFGNTFGKRPSLEEALSEFISSKVDNQSSKKSLSTASTKKPWSPVEDSELPLEFDEDGVNRSGEADTGTSRRHAPLSDDFCARLLATPNLPVPSVIKSLQMFEHGKLGPRALRELMARATDIDEASQYLGLFDEANISIGFSTYPRVIRHFIDSKQFDLLDNLIQSDLHPDTLGDRALQQRLLEYYVSRKENLNARRTIEILKLSEPPPSNTSSKSLAVGLPALSAPWLEATRATLEEYFRILCAVRHKAEVQILIDDMIVQGLSLTDKNLTLLAKSWLQSIDTIKSESDSWQFIPSLSLRVLKSGQVLNHRIWTQMFAVLGVLGRERDMFAVFNFFIRQHYTRPLKAQLFNQLGAESDRVTSPAEEIAAYLAENNINSLTAKFCLPQLTGGIVAWGFRQAIPRLLATTKHQTSPAPVFLSGLRFCSELRRQGFSASRTIVASALRSRLRQLYGIRKSISRRNEVVKRYNYFTIEELLYHTEQLWLGSRLFPDLYNNPDVSPVEYLDPKSMLWTEPSPIDSEVSEEDAAILDTLETGDTFNQTAMDPWRYQSYHDLSNKYGGCLLDGLLFETDSPANAPLTQGERLLRRVALRYIILGKTPPDKPGTDGEQMSQEAWERYIRDSAYVADRLLIQRGRCRPSDWEA